MKYMKFLVHINQFIVFNEFCITLSFKFWNNFDLKNYETRCIYSYM